MDTELTIKQQWWAKHIQAWKTSGLTQSTYCKKHRLPAKQFSSWKSKLTKKMMIKTSSPTRSPKESAFIPVAINHSPSASDELVLTLPNGVSLTGITANNVQLVTQLAQVLT